MGQHEAAEEQPHRRRGPGFDESRPRLGVALLRPHAPRSPEHGDLQADDQQRHRESRHRLGHPQRRGEDQDAKGRRAGRAQREIGIEAQQSRTEDHPEREQPANAGLDDALQLGAVERT